MNKITALENMIAITEKLNALYMSKIRPDGSCDFNDLTFIERMNQLVHRRREAFANYQATA